MDFCADAITRWQHSSHLNAQSEQTPPRRIAIVSGEDELRGPVLRGAPKADALATGVCVINPVGSETEHKWFLLWHPGRRQSPNEAQMEQKREAEPTAFLGDRVCGLCARSACPLRARQAAIPQ